MADLVSFTAGQVPYMNADNLNAIIGIRNIPTVAELETVTNAGSTEVLRLLGYDAPNDGAGGIVMRFPGSSLTRDGGIVFTSLDGGRFLRLEAQTRDWWAAWFGVLPTGTGSTNTTRLNAAITSRGGGDIDLPGGDIYLDGAEYAFVGPHPRPHNVGLLGLGTMQTRIDHTGDNTFNECLDNVSGENLMRRRKVGNFRLFGQGTTNANAKGVVNGNNQHGAIFEELLVSDYAGTNCIGVEIANTLSWTEGQVLEKVHVRNCKKGVAFTRSGTGTDSFSEVRMDDCTITVETNQTGLWFDDNVNPYFSHFDVKIHTGTAPFVGVRCGAGTNLNENHYNIGIETAAGSAGYGWQTAATSRITGTGNISPPLSGGAVDGSNVANHNLDPLSFISITNTPGTALQTAGGSQVWWQVATLPASSALMRDKLYIEILGGPSWMASSLTKDEFFMGNRAASGTSDFTYRYRRTGVDTGASRPQMNVLAYRQTDGSVRVYVRGAASTFNIAAVRAYAVAVSDTPQPELTPLNAKTPSTTDPSTISGATLVFDSSSASYPPNWEHEFGALTIYGALRKANLSSAPTGAEGVSYHDTSVTPNAVRTYVNGAFRRIAYAPVATTPTGTWAQGDIIYSTDVAVGGLVGRVCTVAGTPGTWVPFGLVASQGSATLGADVAATATVNFQDITGLSFAVLSGVIYRFEADIIFTASAATIGSRWGVSGPATPTQLAYTVQVPSVTATYPQVPTYMSMSAYDQMATTTATPATTGNMARIYGVIQPSANGTVILRFAPETATASGVVVKAGSQLRWS